MFIYKIPLMLRCNYTHKALGDGLSGKVRGQLQQRSHVCVTGRRLGSDLEIKYFQLTHSAYAANLTYNKLKRITCKYCNAHMFNLMPGNAVFCPKIKNFTLENPTVDLDLLALKRVLFAITTQLSCKHFSKFLSIFAFFFTLSR